MPKLSIIIPVYNVEKYLRKCLDSVVSQDYDDKEIIVVDDGSTDESPQICDDYEARYNCVHVVHKANGGLVSARKAGLRASSGEYITFVDSDDWLEAGAYASMMDKLEGSHAQCIAADYYEDVGDKSTVKRQDYEDGLYSGDKLRETILPTMMGKQPFFTWGIFPALCTKIFDRHLIEDVLLAEDETIVMGEDTAVSFICFCKAESIYIVHDVFYHYVQKKSSMVKEIPDMTLERKRYSALYKFVLQRIPEYMHESWIRYMIFNMVQRSDNLYDGFYQLPYLFPFTSVKKGSSIILYGAGTYGQRLWNVLKASHFIDIVVWADKNAAEIAKLGLPVVKPDAIESMPSDDIVVAISMGKPRDSAEKELRERFPKKRIHIWDENLIFSDETRRRFRLLRD